MSCYRVSSMYSNICSLEEAIDPVSSVPTTIIGGCILYKQIRYYTDINTCNNINLHGYSIYSM